MKRRRIKAWERRHLHKAFRAMGRELDDHRRWAWMAASPWIVKDDPVFECDVKVTYDPKVGRSYCPLVPFSAKPR